MKHGVTSCNTAKEIFCEPAVGFRTSRNDGKGVVFSATIGTDSSGPDNRLSTVTRGGRIGGVQTGIRRTDDTMVYDANGNLVDDGTYTYDYDELNHRISAARIDTNALVGKYFYDATGKRIAKVAYDASGSPLSYTNRYRSVLSSTPNFPARLLTLNPTSFIFAAAMTSSFRSLATCHLLENCCFQDSSVTRPGSFLQCGNLDVP